MRETQPLTATEKRYLDLYDHKFGEPPARGYAIVGALTFVVSAGLAWWLRVRKVAADGPDGNLSEQAPALSGLEAAVGPEAAFALAAALLVTVSVLALRWRTRSVMRRMQAGYRARYLAAGAEGETSHAP